MQSTYVLASCCDWILQDVMSQQLSYYYLLLLFYYNLLNCCKNKKKIDDRKTPLDTGTIIQWLNKQTTQRNQSVVHRTTDWLAAFFHIIDSWGLITKPNHSQDNALIKLSDLVKSGVRLLLDLRSKAGLGTDTEPNTPWWRLEGCFHGETHLDLQRRSRRWWIINPRRALTLAQSGWRLTPALPCRLPCNK